MDFVRKLKRNRRRKEKDAPKSEREQIVAALDERAERDRYYSRLRAAAERIADDNRRKAFRNPEYKMIDGRLSDAERKAARAEAFGAENLPELQASIKELKARKIALLAGMGMSEFDLQPRYRCKKCSDTGFMSDGRACDCYRPKR